MKRILDMASGAFEESVERTEAAAMAAQDQAPFTPARLQLAVQEFSIATDNSPIDAQAANRQRLLAAIKDTD